MSIENLYILSDNPFRITPANPENLVWAGFPEIKNKFKIRIKRTLKIRSSSLILNWGEYGSGKTHAAKYFNREDVLRNIASETENGIPLPYSVVLTLPKGRNPIYDLYVSIIDKLNIDKIRSQFKNDYDQLSKFVESFIDNLHIQNVIKTLFKFQEKDNKDILKKYLYGSLTKSELKSLSKQGIYRNLNTDNDYILFLSALFSSLTFKRKHYSSIIMWIDEFEDLAILSNSNIDKTNNFLREIIDHTPDHLLIFLNLTQSALFGVEDLGEYLYEAVRSRIKDRINFDLPNTEDFIEYVEDLLSKYRSGQVTDNLFPFNAELIKKIHSDLGNVSIRAFNDALSILLELGDMEEVVPLTAEFYEENKSDIIGWRE